MSTSNTEADINGCSAVCGRGLDHYRAALRTGEIAGNVPQCLINLGLLRKLEADVRASADPMDRYMPVPPAIAARNLSRPLEEVIETQRSRLTELAESLSPLEAVYQREQRERQTHVQHLVGEDTVNGAIKLAAAACEHELLSAQPHFGNDTDALNGTLPTASALPRPGVRHRGLFSHTMRSHGPTLSQAERLCRAGAKIRTVGAPFESLIVCDRVVAFIPVPAPTGLPPRALAVREPGVIEYLARTFEALWERAEPLVVDAHPHRTAPLTDAVQRTILELMVRGQTDAAISKRVGLSVRTISTHIKRASEFFESHSRAELGYRLAKSGALDIDRARHDRDPDDDALSKTFENRSRPRSVESARANEQFTAPGLRSR